MKAQIGAEAPAAEAETGTASRGPGPLTCQARCTVGRVARTGCGPPAKAPLAPAKVGLSVTVAAEAGEAAVGAVAVAGHGAGLVAGDIRSAILALLAERPMHGYEIIGELAERTDGLWRPSPGSIYPTLQLLEDEGLVTAQPDDAGGKRRYALTEEGQRAAAEVAQGPAPWEAVAAGAPEGARALRQSLVRLLPVVRQVMMSGGPREYEEVAKLLDETRRRIYAILASEPAGTGPTGTAPAGTGPTGTGPTGTGPTGTASTGTASTGTASSGTGPARTVGNPEGPAGEPATGQS